MKFLYLILLFPLLVFSQIPVDVNSGDPAFPFPQFLAYESDSHSLGNLATQNAPGVTHAEMEQTIRDAWQIMMNRSFYTGDNIGGVDLIHFLSSPDVTEGDGYALLGAAYMADKTSFDGLWIWTHENRMNSGSVRKLYYYSDGAEIPGTVYSACPGWLGTGTNCAFDGDTDIALALLMAYKNWGENSGIMVRGKDGVLKEMNYKEEALEFIRGLVEKAEGDVFGDDQYPSGSVGWDGYMKGGDTWGELTNWAFEQVAANGGEGPQTGLGGGGNITQHIDYFSPAYFNAFSEFLEEENDSEDVPWNLSQLARGEASADWLMGKMIDDSPSTIPTAGWVSLGPDNVPEYTNFVDGEDFRNPWRTILNYVWNGNPTTTWNPETHQVEEGENTYEIDIATRFAKFLANHGDSPWDNECGTVGGGPGLTYSGPSQLKQYYDPSTGKSLSDFPLNWLAGTGSPTAVAVQDYDLMAKLYRQCAIEWDTQSAGDGYLTSVPGYFHGWFRLLGMMVNSGNHHNPEKLNLESNVKVYHKLDKTFAFTGDELEYTISYRNYASIDAEGVSITTTLPTGLSFVSATDGGVNSGSSVSWDIGSVPGFKTATGVAGASGQVTMKVKVDSGFSGRICNAFELSTTNGKGWISNEFPNEETAVMQRNCVDIVEKALEITKTVNHDEVNPGDVLTYEVDFENASSGGFINGGRQDVVVAYAHGGHVEESSEQLVKIRLYHGAAEPYIDYGNYRISMFLNDNAVTCVAGEEGCDGVAWQLDNQIYEGGDAAAVSITSEKIVPGSDQRGNWNQRVIVKFSEQLATITPHISRYFGLEGGRVHQGGATPLRAVWQMHNTSWSSSNWSDDWSWNPQAVDGSGGLYYPVTNDWTDPNNPDLPVNVYHNEACETPDYTVDNILVEEWDGFTWRRVYGNSPTPGRETENVIVKDILPEGFTFVGFIDDSGKDLGLTTTVLDEVVSYDEATRTISWTRSGLQVKEGGGFKYQAIANFSSGTCSRADEVQINTASIEADNESPVIVTAEVNVTCEPVILPPAESSMVKEVSPVSAEVGEEVVYSLSYKNTDGSVFESDFSESWTSQEGPLMTVNSAGVTSTPGVSAITTNDFSHGTNGVIEATITFADNAAFGFALRHSGVAGVENGLYVIFKPNSGGGDVQTSVYNGLTQIGDTDTRSLKISQSLLADVKLELIDDQLNVWLGDTTSPIPSLTFNGLPEQSGFTGVINGFPDGGTDIFGSHHLARFYSAMDSAFNVQITDPIPGELSFVSSAEGENINGVVTFPMLEGPVLADAEISYEWTAEIVSCPADLQAIENIAFTNVFGIEENSIAAQAILDCSGLDLCGDLPEVPELIEGEEILICSGDSTEINAENYAETTSGDFELIWFDGPSKFDNEIDAPIVDTTLEGEFTYYVAQIEDVVCGEGDRVAITFVVGDGAEGTTVEVTIESGETVDFDVVSEMGFTAGNVQWIALENTNIEGESILAVTDDTITDVLTNTSSTDQIVEYSIEELSPSDCGKGISTLIVTVTSSLCLTDAPEVEIVEYCLNEVISESLDSYVIANGTLLWYADNELTSAAITMPIIDTSLLGGITYYVSQVIDDCESVRVEILVKEREASTEVIEHTEVILSNESLSFDIPFETGLIAGSFEWSVSNNLNVTGHTTSISNEVVITDTLINDSNFDRQIEYTITPFDCNELTHVLSVTVRVLPSVEINTSAVVEGDDLEVELIFSKPTVSVTTIVIGLNPGAINGVSADDLSLDNIALVIPEGSENYSFTIPTIDDVLSEPSENLEISIQNVAPENLSSFSEIAEVAIIDNDGLPSILIDDIEILEGETKAVDIRLSNPSSEDITITVSLVFTNDTTTDGDFELLDTGSITVSFAAGQTEPITQTNITAIDDSIPEGDQVLIVSVDTVDNGVLNDSSDTAEITIIDDDLAPTILIDDVTVNEGDTVEIPIYLRTPALDRIELVVTFRDVDTDGDFDTTMQTVVFEAGSRTPTVPLEVETFQDFISENDEDFIVFIEIEDIIEGTVNFGGFIGLDSGIVTIQDDDTVPDVIISGTTVEEGETREINIQLSSVAIDDVTVVLQFLNTTTTDADYTVTSQVVSFSAGNRLPDTPISISASADTLVEGTEVLEVSVLSIDSGSINDSSDTGIITIEDGVDVTPNIIISGLTVEEGETREINIELSSVAIDEVIVTLQFVNTTTTDEDYIITSQVVTFSAGNILPDTPISISASADTLVEGTEALEISVLSIDSGSINDSSDTAQVTIEDDTDEEAVVFNGTKYGLSPDGDGINEFWEIDDIESYPNNEVLIYNRWGNLVYRTTNYDNSFNVFSGEANQQTNLGAGELLSGTYFYEIKIDGEHDFNNLKGFLVLKR